MPRRKAGKASSSQGNIIATRELDVEGSRRKAVVTMWQPMQRDGTTWICAYRVPGVRRPRRARGADAFEALIHALEGIRYALDKHPGRYDWFGEDPRDHGFPLVVPYGFGGLRLVRRLEQVLDREVTDYFRALRASEASQPRDCADRD